MDIVKEMGVFNVGTTGSILLYSTQTPMAPTAAVHAAWFRCAFSSYYSNPMLKFEAAVMEIMDEEDEAVNPWTRKDEVVVEMHAM